MTLAQLTKRSLIVLAPAALFVAGWHLLTVQNPRAAFLFGQPEAVIRILAQRVQDGSLFLDVAATLGPVVGGFLLGNLTGIVLGLVLWRFKNFNRLARPYLIALGAVPAFVFAPVFVVWFGTGVLMKLVIVFLSTVLVAAFQASTGAAEIDPDYFDLMRTFRARDRAIFRLLVLPSAAAWVFTGLRLNVGFALLGGFVGEFISSERGLAHRALVDAGLYNLSAVWASAFVIAVMALLLYRSTVQLETVLLPWKQSLPTRVSDNAVSPSKREK